MLLIFPVSAGLIATVTPITDSHYALDNLYLEHDLAVPITLNADVRASDVSHKMETIWLKAFAEPLIYQRHRDGRVVKSNTRTSFLGIA